jgi:hypothetical protein
MDQEWEENSSQKRGHSDSYIFEKNTNNKTNTNWDTLRHIFHLTN